MISRHFFTILSLMLVALPLTTDARAADPAAANSAILKLLDVGWQSTASARTAADQQFQTALELAPGDSRTMAAYWLVLIRQGRHAEALTQLNAYLDRQSASLTALQAKAWVEAMLKKHSKALATADRLSDLIAGQPMAEGGPQDEAIQFLGKLFGYLAGPLEKLADQANRDRVEVQVTARLDERRKALFTAARDSIREKYDELAGDAEDAVDAAQKAAADEKEQALGKIGEQRTELDKQAKEVAERKKKAQQQLEANLRQLDNQDATLVQNGRNLQQQAQLLENEVRRYEDEARRYIDRDKGGKETRDPRYSQAKRNADFARNKLNQVTFQLNQVQADRNALEAQRAQAQTAAGSQAQQLNSEQQGLDKNKRRLEGQEKRKAGSKTGAATGQTVALENKLRAFTTYYQLPLESYRSKLTASLQPAP